MEVLAGRKERGDLDALKAKAIDTAASTRLELGRAAAALDVLQLVSGNPDPLAAFDVGGELQAIAQAIPLPVGVVTTFQNAGDRIAQVFNDLRAPCNVSLPPALSGLIGRSVPTAPPYVQSTIRSVRADCEGRATSSDAG